MAERSRNLIWDGAMDIVLITTTIRVPEVLRLYRELDSSVFFVVVGDKKSPNDEIRKLIKDVGSSIYLDDIEQQKYKCSEAIGWNCIMRRNIALLEAIKLNPKHIVTIDDDVFPLDPRFFSLVSGGLTSYYPSLIVKSESGWLNTGEFLIPTVCQRGFPASLFPCKYSVLSRERRAVGVVAGLSLGDPDINAWERGTRNPIVHSVSELVRNSLVADDSNFVPFNSQNTAYYTKLAPLMAVLPGIGRHDDIWGSLVAERVMMEKGWSVRFGPPFVWQERNQQSLAKNIKDELYGMQYTVQFGNNLLNMNLGLGHPVEMLARVYEQMGELAYIPEQTKEFCRAWIEDLEAIL
jgi:hypothetical protein